MSTTVAPPPGARRSRRSLRLAASGSLGFVLIATIVVLTAGAALKAPCASPSAWNDLLQDRHGCYSDIVPLYTYEHLDGTRLPYLDRCASTDVQPCDEYPPVTMYFMRAAAWLGRSSGSFFWVNAAGLAALALLTVWLLYQMVGRRALYFALAPTLLFFGFWNWDLIPVALTTAATLLFLRRRDGWSGALLGLGIAAKLYPILVLAAFVLHRMRGGRRSDARALVGWAGAAWALTNVPFMLAAFGPWSNFFRFNALRSAGFDGLWFVACARYVGGPTCPWSGGMVFTLLGVATFVVVLGFAWWARTRRNPEFPRWQLAFPLIAAALLANKLYSPQYSLWLIPWFALTVPNVWVFAGFELAEIGVWFATLGWQGRLLIDRLSTVFVHDAGGLSVHHVSAGRFGGYRGLPFGSLQLAVAIRDLILLLAIAAWATQEPLPVRFHLHRERRGTRRDGPRDGTGAAPVPAARAS